VSGLPTNSARKPSERQYLVSPAPGQHQQVVCGHGTRAYPSFGFQFVQRLAKSVELFLRKKSFAIPVTMVAKGEKSCYRKKSCYFLHQSLFFYRMTTTVMEFTVRPDGLVTN